MRSSGRRSRRCSLVRRGAARCTHVYMYIYMMGLLTCWISQSIDQPIHNTPHSTQIATPAAAAGDDEEKEEETTTTFHVLLRGASVSAGDLMVREHGRGLLHQEQVRVTGGREGWMDG